MVEAVTNHRGTGSRDSKAQLTVVFPLVDVRGRAAAHVRTWTHDQTLARERYRVVVASDGTAPSQEREVVPLLGPRDDLHHAAAAHEMMALWNAGAAAAGTPWLVFTEGHCLADPGCLAAVARWIAANPTAEVGNFKIGHYDHYLMARMSQRWFDMIHARWRAPGEWPRIHGSGFAIRTDIFEAIGGVESEYGLFAVHLLSARLHARGIRIRAIPGAVVMHLDDERMRDHHADTGYFVRDEIEARSRIDPVFFERYFGHAPVWANQLRIQPRIALHMARAVVAAAMAYPERTTELVTLLRPLTMIVGIAPRVALQRLAVTLDEVAVERLPLPADRRWSRFLRAHARVVRMTYLERIGRRRPRAVPPASGRWSIEQLGPDTISGVHALEKHGERLFRWMEPIALVRLAPSEGEHELRIETGGIRGNPLAALIAVVVGGRVLPRDLLTSDDDGTLIVRLSAPWAAAAGNDVVLVCSPLAPARMGSSDLRILGLPILSITTVPLHTRGRTESVAA